MLFTFPSRYSSTIGLTGVFSLAGWSRRIRAGFHVSRATQGSAMSRGASRKGLSPSMAGLSRPFRSRHKVQPRGPTTPGRPGPPRFGLLPVRSPLLGESLLFSLPAGTKMFQFPALASRHRRDGTIKGAGLSHWPFAPTRGFSQLTTPFVASVSLGIHHAPLLAFPYIRRLPVSPRAGTRPGTRGVACANMSKNGRRQTARLRTARTRWRITDSNR